MSSRIKGVDIKSKYCAMGIILEVMLTKHISQATFYHTYDKTPGDTSTYL